MALNRHCSLTGAGEQTAQACANACLQYLSISSRTWGCWRRLAHRKLSHRSTSLILIEHRCFGRRCAHILEDKRRLLLDCRQGSSLRVKSQFMPLKLSLEVRRRSISPSLMASGSLVWLRNYPHIGGPPTTVALKWRHGRSWCTGGTTTTVLALLRLAPLRKKIFIWSLRELRGSVAFHREGQRCNRASRKWRDSAACDRHRQLRRDQRCHLFPRLGSKIVKG